LSERAGINLRISPVCRAISNPLPPLLPETKKPDDEYGGHMKLRWAIRLLCLVSCVTPVVTAQVPINAQLKIEQQPSQVTKSHPKGSDDSDIFPEEPESSSPEVREARRAKNTRYNTAGVDLTVELPPGSEIFFDQFWPNTAFIPASKSAVIAVGTVVKVQPYLSSDRHRIYTEITIKVDDLLKLDRDDRLSTAKTLVIDRLGGKLRLNTSRIVSDGTQIDDLGKPRFGKRYLLFGESVNNGNDINLIKSYELVDGKTFTDDSGPSRLISAMPEVPESWGDETAFLAAVREKIRKEAGRPKAQ